MLIKINTIFALTLLMTFLCPISEIFSIYGHLNIYQNLLFIFPYALLSLIIFKKI